MDRRELDSVFGDNTIARPGKEEVSLNGFTDLPEGMGFQSVGGTNSSDGSREPSNPRRSGRPPADTGNHPSHTPDPFETPNPIPTATAPYRNSVAPKAIGPCYIPGFPEPGRCKA